MDSTDKSSQRQIFQIWYHTVSNRREENDYLGHSSRCDCKKEVAEIRKAGNSLKGGDEMGSKINIKKRASNSGYAGFDSFRTTEIMSHRKRQVVFLGNHQESKQQCRYPHVWEESYTKPEVTRASEILVFTSAGTDKWKFCTCLLLILFPASSLHGPALLPFQSKYGRREGAGVTVKVPALFP